MNLQNAVSSPEAEVSPDPVNPPDIGMKGQRTRAQLVTAAREIFAEKGYFSSRLSDITNRVGCSTGTLYTYFRNREDLLAAVIEEAQQSVIHASRTAGVDEDPVARIYRANREYIDSYCENADLMTVMEQVSWVDPHIKRIRSQRSNAFIERNRRSIEKLQHQGLVEDSLNPHLVSLALSSMVSRLCFHVYVDEKDPVYRTAAGREELTRTVSELWVESLNLSRTSDQPSQDTEDKDNT